MARDFGSAGTGVALFAADEMVYTEANVCTRLSYNGIRRLRVFPEGVVFTHVGLFGVFALPTHLIPPGALDRMAAGAESRGSAVSDADRLTLTGVVDPETTRSFVADRKTTSRLCRASPESGRPYWERMARLALVGVIVSVTWWYSQGRSIRESVLLLGIWFIGLGLRVIRDRQRLRKAMDAGYAPGRQLIAHFDTWGMTYGNRLVTTTCAYAAIERIDVVNRVVLLKLPVYGTVMLPGELVPESIVARLRTMIGSQRPDAPDPAR